MKNFCLQKRLFTSILITLLITFQVSSCSTEETLTAATANINPDLITDSGTNENTTTAEINLSWVAPAEREDNSSISLSEIAGYQVFYGSSQGQYSNSVIINDGTAVGYTFTDLPSGTYYIVVTTIDTEGRESQFSPVLTIAI